MSWRIKGDCQITSVYTSQVTLLILSDLLLSTGEQDIVENAPGDYYWGCGKDGTGLNKLGLILVKVRSKIRNAS